MGKVTKTEKAFATAEARVNWESLDQPPGWEAIHGGRRRQGPVAAGH